MTVDQIKRLRELCDAADQGVLRGDELGDLVGLAREQSFSLEDVVYLLRQSDTKRFAAYAQINRLEHFEKRWHALNYMQRRDPTAKHPCLCGHNQMDHWLGRGKCDLCECKKADSAYAVRCPESCAWCEHYAKR